MTTRTTYVPLRRSRDTSDNGFATTVRDMYSCCTVSVVVCVTRMTVHTMQIVSREGVFFVLSNTSSPRTAPLAATIVLFRMRSCVATEKQ